MSAAGEVRDLEIGEIVNLAPGDALRYGTASWLRYEPPAAVAGHQTEATPETDANA